MIDLYVTARKIAYKMHKTYPEMDKQLCDDAADEAVMLFELI